MTLFRAALRSIRKALVCGVVGLLFSNIAYADKPAKPPAGMGKYVMFLKEARPVPPGQQNKPIVVPDVAKLGGKLVHGRDQYRVIFLPPQAVKRLLDDENVDYVQRIWMGEPAEDWENVEVSGKSSPDLTSMSDQDGPAWGPKSYTYDGAGNIKTIGADSFQYDPVSRLKQAVVNGTTETYQYDAFGNLTTKQIAGQPSTTLPVDSASNRLAGESYDIAGNVTRGGEYSYDSLGMMSATTVGTGSRRFYYTADDERIGIQVDGSIARWKFRDFEGHVLREFWTAIPMSGWEGADWFWTEDYVYADGRLVGGETAGPWGTGSGGITTDRRKRHFHLDHLGSVRLITTDTRVSLGVHSYYPFGVEQTVFYQEEQTYGGSGAIRPEPMRYAGHERDYNGYWNAPNTDTLDYMHARYYDPNLGRFLSVDPAMDVEANMVEPQRWNRYAYATNNPLKFTDPDGRERLAYWHFNRQPVPDRGFKTEMIETSKTAAMVGGMLFGGPILRAGWQIAVGFVLGNPQGARQLADAALSPTGSSTMPLPTLSGSVREMAGEAIGFTAAMKGSASQKVEAFAQLAGQIEKASGGAWSATQIAGTKGSTVFFGRAGEALVIAANGQVFRGKLNEGIKVVKGVAEVAWNKVTLVK